MNDTTHASERTASVQDAGAANDLESYGMSVGVKGITFMTIILLSVGTILSWHFLSEAERNMTSELRAKSESLTTNLARSSKWGLLSEDEVVLDEIIGDILQEDAVLYVAISNSRGDILASRVRDGVDRAPIELAILHAESLAASNGPEDIHYHDIDSVGTYHTYMPVETTPAFRSQMDADISDALLLLGETPRDTEVSDEADRYGNVQLLVSSEKLFSEITNTFITGAGLTIAIVLVAIALSYLFCRRVLGPVKAMATAARKIAAGDLSQRVTAKSNDEIGVLAKSFNQMTASLSKMTRMQAERLEALSALHEVGLSINSTLDVDEVIDLTLDVVVRRLGYSRAVMFLADWKKRTLTHGRVVGANDEVAAQIGKLHIPLNNQSGFFARAALSGQSVLVDDAEKVRDQGHETTYQVLGPGSLLVVPLMMNERAVGVMGVESRPGHKLGKSDTALMETLANQMAIAISNAMSFTEIEQLNVGLEAKVKERTVELQEQQAKLKQMNKELVDATRHKSEFLANMSHELRTPLNAVIGYSELLQEEMEDDQIEEYIPDLRKINSAGKHLLALINDVLDLSKIEAGKMDVHIEEADVADIVNEVGATIKPLIESFGNRFEIKTARGPIRTDITKLRQVLFNLLSNAAKFTENGKISVSVSRSTDGAGDEWLFSIKDTGVGIAPDKMNRLFEEFSQLDADVARKHGGTGLGLAISQRFCRMLGGEITVKSKLRQGSTFTVRLPAGVEEKKKRPAKKAKAKAGADDRCDVLVIDDDPAVRDLVSRYLSKDGFNVRTAASGKEGLDSARKLKPAAITLDLLMPEVDGWSVLTQLKADPELARIPVVVLTILDDEEMGYTLGAADYLTKPVDQQRLIAIIRRHCGRETPAPILVIEDDPDSRQILTSMLEKEDLAVTAVGDAEQGLEQLKKKLPALILLDLMLPGMDGFQFIETVQENDAWKSIPIVVVTAKDLSKKELEFLTQSVQKIRKKGAYTRDELIDVVRATMQHTIDHGEAGATQAS